MKPFPRANRKGRVPAFSVIIPTCNRPQFLADAVASVLAQRDAEFELLIVNDGLELPPLPADPRLRHLENARRGAIVARNFGIASARGGWISWLDDDDLWKDPLHLARAASRLADGADFTFADGVMQFDTGAPPRLFAKDASVETLARDNTILLSAVSYRRDLHDRLGGFEPSLPYYADWDWYLRVARAGFRIERIATPTVAIRIHGSNTSASSEAARRENLQLLSARHGLGTIALKTHADFV